MVALPHAITNARHFETSEILLLKPRSQEAELTQMSAVIHYLEFKFRFNTPPERQCLRKLCQFLWKYCIHRDTV